MTNNPLVSVVIPTYYRNNRLQATIESVERQEYDPIEVLVVDGSEGKHARSVAKGFDATYIHQGEAGGAHAARSMGAERASGRYVNFLDDDDRLHRRKLAKQVPMLEDGDSVGVVYCGIRWDNGHIVLPDTDVQGDVLEYALMFQMTPSSPSAMLIDAEVLAEILPLGNCHGADDMGMKIELAQRTEFDFVDEPLVYKGHSEDSLGGSRENIDGRMQLLHDYDDLYAEYPSSVRRTALAHTCLLDAEITLNRNIWSFAAIRKSAYACYRIPGTSLTFVGYLAASLFGRPGRSIARRLYSRIILANEHRGKIT